MPRGLAEPSTFDMSSVTVIIPVKDRQELLTRNVERLLIQTERPRVLVFDDASEVPLAFNTEGVEIHRSDDPVGQCAARNFWFHQVNTKYVKWIDSDDYLDGPTVLADQIQFMEDRPGLDFCWDGVSHLDYRRRRIVPAAIREDIRLDHLELPEWYIHGHTTFVPYASIQIGTALFKTSSLQGVSWDENFKHGGADLKFFSDVVKAGLTGEATGVRGVVITTRSPGPKTGGRYA